MIVNLVITKLDENGGQLEPNLHDWLSHKSLLLPLSLTPMTLWASSTPCRFSRLADNRPPASLLVVHSPSKRASARETSDEVYNGKERESDKRKVGRGGWVGGVTR